MLLSIFQHTWIFLTQQFRMMKTKDIPIVFLGLGILYMAYLFQNKMIRIPEGFQGTGQMPGDPSMQPASAMPPATSMQPATPMQPASAMQPASDIPPSPSNSPSPGPPSMQPSIPIPPPNQAQLQSMSVELKQVAQNSQKLDAISQQLQQMSQMQPAPREGFQSYQNPYNMSSPSTSQAYEFRLGKKSLTDEVLSVMNR